jgi:hypothetical protein
MHIRTRNDLIKWLEDNAPRPCIRRALTEGGTNENLGAFSCVIPSHPGWIVKICGKMQTWIVATKPHSVQEYITCVLKEVPWKYWEGDKSENPLYQGDNPEKYKEMRDESK